jgi:hypothetical protein
MNRTTFVPFEWESSFKDRDGAAEARKDIADQCPKLKVYGLRSSASDYYAMLLASKLGIAQQTIAGCVVDEGLVKYANAYNTVISEYAETKFGKGIFEKLMTEADQLSLQHPLIGGKWLEQHRPPHAAPVPTSGQNH